MKYIPINYYVPFFHDGSIINIEHFSGRIDISMQSAQIDKEDIREDIALSSFHRIKGKLHLENITSVFVDDVLFLGKLKMLHDKGSIFDFELNESEIELQIAWVDFPPKPDVNEFSVIKIFARNIWWENIPDLLDPFW